MRNGFIFGLACIFSFLLVIPLANAQIVEETHYKKLVVGQFEILV
jgi:hypothetical protein